MSTTITILEPGAQQLLNQSIAGYRIANAAIDAAIQAENWKAINQAQGVRELHASTIALIVNAGVVNTCDGGQRS